MKCIAYAVAEKYDIDSMAKFLRIKGLEPKFYDDVIHVTHIEEIPASLEEGTPVKQDIFIFPYGCIVGWSVSYEFTAELIEELYKFATNSYDKPFEEIINFSINPEEKTYILEEEDLIILEEDEELIKLSFSHALSQSVKLEVFERRVNKTIEQTRYLSDELASKGRISLSRRKLAQQTGALFAERNSINLDTDLLDMPEFFWRRPRYEPFYLMASHYMDINTRLDILNRRLDAIHELYDILSNELNHLHSSRLEMIIVVLILIEVIMAVLRDLFKWI